MTDTCAVKTCDIKPVIYKGASLRLCRLCMHDFFFSEYKSGGPLTVEEWLNERNED